jgi:hypothetical protein
LRRNADTYRCGDCYKSIDIVRETEQQSAALIRMHDQLDFPRVRI